MEASNKKLEYLKVGSEVLLTNRRGSCWNAEGKMDRYLGRVVKIKSLSGESFSIYQDEQDNSQTWWFMFDDIQTTISVPFKVGDYVTTKNEMFVKSRTIFGNPLLTKLMEDYDKRFAVVADAKTFDKLDFIGQIYKLSYTLATDSYIITVRSIKNRNHQDLQDIEFFDSQLFKLHMSNEEKITDKQKESEEKIMPYKYATSDYNENKKVNSVFTCSLPKRNIPSVDSYRVYGNKTVVVTFTDGTRTHSTCCDNDIFDLETGIEKCILKKAFGKNVRTQILAVIKNQQRKEEKELELKKKEEEDKKRREEKFLKNRERKLKRRAQKQAEFEVAVALQKEEIMKKLNLTPEQKQILNEEV